MTQLEIMPQPPVKENKPLVWPDWPLKLRTSSSQEEGCERDWSVLTKRAIGEDGKITGLECVRVEWQLGDGGQMKLVEVPGSEFTLKADLVLLAMGFVGPRKPGLVEQAGVELDARGNVKAHTDQLQDQRRQDLLLRRHAPRPVAGGLGDPRRPPMRARRGRVPDGLERAAAITPRINLGADRSAKTAMPKIDIAAVPQRKGRAIRRRSMRPVPSACGSGWAMPAG